MSLSFFPIEGKCSLGEIEKPLSSLESPTTMPDLEFDDLLNSPEPGKPNTTQAPASYSGGNIFIQLPDAIGSLIPTGRAILDELKDWHKRIDKQGGREAHPSYLLTIDKIPESLGKFSNLGAQAKTEQTISQAIRQIIDLDRKGLNRVGYAYPFLIRNGTKITAKIALIAPQKENKTDVSPYRQACFHYSQDLVKLLIQNRSKKGKGWDEGDRTHLLFFQNKEGKPYFYPRLLSLEAEITGLVRRGFGIIPPIPLDDFNSDCMVYAKSQNLVNPILDDYHIPVDELELNSDGSFKKAPEVAEQLVTHVLSLGRFAKDYLVPIAKENKYESFLAKMNELFGKLKFQNVNDKMEAHLIAKDLIDTIDTYPFGQSKSQSLLQIRETCDLSAKIIKRLIDERIKLGGKQEGNTYAQIESKILQNIEEYTKNSLSLYRFDFIAEIKKFGIQEDDKLQSFSKRLKDSVLSTYSYHEIRSDKKESTFFIVDQGYMAAVLNHLTFESKDKPDLLPQLEYAKIIDEKLQNPRHPGLNAKLNADLVEKLLKEISNFEIKKQEEQIEKEKSSMLNIPMGSLAFGASSLSFITGAYLFDSSGPVMFGIPFSVVLGILAALFFREKSDKEIKKEAMQNVGLSVEESGDDHHEGTDKKDSKEDKIEKIFKTAEQFTFPKNFAKITEKVMTPKSIKAKVEANLDQIQKHNALLTGEKDRSKVISTVEYAIHQSCATIQIPADLQIEEFPSTLFITQKDLKSSLFRQQLADAYREEMEKKKFDKKLVRYYSFLINTIEMEYYKYLPKRKG